MGNAARKNVRRTTTQTRTRTTPIYPNSSVSSKRCEVHDEQKSTKGMGWPRAMGKQWYGEQVR